MSYTRLTVDERCGRAYVLGERGRLPYRAARHVG